MRQGVFQAPEVGLLFEEVSLGPPYEKSQKMGDLGVLAEFVITCTLRAVSEPRFAAKCCAMFAL